MYFWHDLKLAQDLKDEKVSDRDIAQYFFLFLISNIFYDVNFIDLPTFQDIGRIFIGAVIPFYILYKTFKYNDVKRFILNVICLHTPIFIRSATIMVISGIPLFMLWLIAVIVSQRYGIVENCFPVLYEAENLKYFMDEVLKWSDVISKIDDVALVVAIAFYYIRMTVCLRKT